MADRYALQRAYIAANHTPDRALQPKCDNCDHVFEPGDRSFQWGEGRQCLTLCEPNCADAKAAREARKH
jgi:hypothetical protein